VFCVMEVEKQQDPTAEQSYEIGLFFGKKFENGKYTQFFHDVIHAFKITEEKFPEFKDRMLNAGACFCKKITMHYIHGQQEFAQGLVCWGKALLQCSNELDDSDKNFLDEMITRMTRLIQLPDTTKECKG
jgi:hypothetical protein